MDLSVGGVDFSSILELKKVYRLSDGSYDIMGFLKEFDPLSAKLFDDSYGTNANEVLNRQIGPSLDNIVSAGGMKGGSRFGNALVLILYLLTVSAVVSTTFDDTYKSTRVPPDPGDRPRAYKLLGWIIRKDHQAIKSWHRRNNNLLKFHKDADAESALQHKKADSENSVAKTAQTLADAAKFSIEHLAGQKDSMSTMTELLRESRAEFKAAKNEVKNLEDQVATKSYEISKLEKDLAASHRLRQGLGNANLELQTALSTAKAELARAQSNLSKAEADASKAASDMSRLQRENDELKSKVGTLSNQNDILTGENTVLKGDTASLQSLQNELKKALDTLAVYKNLLNGNFNGNFDPILFAEIIEKARRQQNVDRMRTIMGVFSVFMGLNFTIGGLFYYFFQHLRMRPPDRDDDNGDGDGGDPPQGPGGPGPRIIPPAPQLLEAEAYPGQIDPPGPSDGPDDSDDDSDRPGSRALALREDPRDPTARARPATTVKDPFYKSPPYRVEIGRPVETDRPPPQKRPRPESPKFFPPKPLPDFFKPPDPFPINPVPINPVINTLVGQGRKKTRRRKRTRRAKQTKKR